MLTDEQIDAITDAQWGKGCALNQYRAHRAYARAIIEAALSAPLALPPEPVAWESRFLDESNGPGEWSQWERVLPRNIHTDTVADRVREFQSYIDRGYKYELRALYTHPPVPAQEVRGVRMLTEADILDGWKRANDALNDDYSTHDWSDFRAGAVFALAEGTSIPSPAQPQQPNTSPIADVCAQVGCAVNARMTGSLPCEQGDAIASVPEEVRWALDHAEDWITQEPHGDNCFLHDDGGEFDACFCGRDGALQSIEIAFDVIGRTAPSTADNEVQFQNKPSVNLNPGA